MAERSADALLLAASAHMKAGAFQAALGSASEALDMLAGTSEKSKEAKAWQGVMSARLALGRYKEALKAAEASLVTCTAADDEEGRALTLLGVARAQLKSEEPQKSLKAGNMALELFRRLGSRSFEQAAVHTVVQALLALEREEEALRQATLGVTKLEQAGEGRIAALAMKSVMLVHLSLGEVNQAASVAQRAAGIFRDLGEKALQAETLLDVARLHGSVGELSEAKLAAEQALPVFTDLGDAEGLAAATEVFGAAEDAQQASRLEDGDMQEHEALMMRVVEAFELRRGMDLRQACEECYNKGIPQRRLKELVAPMMSKAEDREAAKDFWIDNQPQGYEFGDGTHSCGVYIDRMDLYMFQRLVGMMGYGPGFRLIKQTWRKGTHQESKEGNSSAMAILTLKDDCDDWEEHVLTHPGVIDCALQSGTAWVFPIEHSSEKK